MLFWYSKASPHIEDFHCPYCEQSYSIDSWDTDHGEPIDCSETIKCEKCNNEFMVFIRITLKFKTSKF